MSYFKSIPSGLASRFYAWTGQIPPQFGKVPIEKPDQAERDYWRQFRDHEKLLGGRSVQNAPESDSVLPLSGRSVPAPKPIEGPQISPLLDSVRYYLSVPLNWTRQYLHFKYQLLAALDVIFMTPLPGGLIDSNHPLATGIDPHSQKPIWHQNVLFHTNPQGPFSKIPQADDVILTGLGTYLLHLLKPAVATGDHPDGIQGRMPHGVNYMHAVSHYNSGWLLFNTYEEAIYYLSDPKFVKEMRRFAKQEKREILIVIRDRLYGRRDLLDFAGVVRTVNWWFANTDGPQKTVGWGNPAPYATVNALTGAWIRDIYQLKNFEGRKKVVRPPVPADTYFQDEYVGNRMRPRVPEYLLGAFTEWKILRFRGSKHRNGVVSDLKSK